MQERRLGRWQLQRRQQRSRQLYNRGRQVATHDKQSS